MSVTDREISAAESMGRIAARSKLPVSSCPYEADGDADQRTLAQKFVRAWLAAGGRTAVRFDDHHYTHGPV